MNFAENCFLQRIFVIGPDVSVRRNEFADSGLLPKCAIVCVLSTSEAEVNHPSGRAGFSELVPTDVARDSIDA